MSNIMMAATGSFVTLLAASSTRAAIPTPLAFAKADTPPRVGALNETSTQQHRV